MGQVGLLVSLLLFAVLLGLVPDRQNAIRHGRARLAEAIVVRTTNLITQGEILDLEKILDVFKHRNDDLLSAAVRRNDGSDGRGCRGTQRILETDARRILIQFPGSSAD